jgi:serine/threonine protein kinase
MAYLAPEGTSFVEHLGFGTMFDVALVDDGGRLVVCKRLVRRVVAEAAGRAALSREVGLLSRARHPVLPEIVRAAEDAHGPFVLESRVEGASLAAGGEFLRRAGGALPPPFILDVAVRAASSLAALHELADEDGPLGVVHGDLAPDHLFRSNEGAIAFVDFGAARFRGMIEDADEDRGTLPFVAPEVARGEARPSQATDVYALAAILVAFATGEPLTHGATDAAMLLEIGEHGLDSHLVDRLPGVTATGREALRAAITFEPEKRLDSARELAARLRR